MQLNGKSLKPEWFSKVQQMRNEEVDFLYEMVEQTEGDIFEIGMGGSTFAFLDATKDTDRQVWSIDMRNKLEKYYDYIPQDYQERLNFIQADSHQTVLRKEFGLLLIDGDHHFDAVRKDTMSFWSNVSDDGLILYHDYDLKEVNQFVDSWIYDFEYALVHKIQNNLIALKKI